MSNRHTGLKNTLHNQQMRYECLRTGIFCLKMFNSALYDLILNFSDLLILVNEKRILKEKVLSGNILIKMQRRLNIKINFICIIYFMY